MFELSEINGINRALPSGNDGFAATQQRSLFKIASDLVRSLSRKFAKGDIRIFATQLTMEAALSPNKSTLTFNLGSNANGVFNGTTSLSSLLEKNDIFFASGARIQIAKYLREKGTQNAFQGGNSPRFTYPDKNIFLDPTEWYSLFNIWNGKLRFLTGSTQRFEMPTYDLLHTPSTQDAATFANFLHEFNGKNDHASRGYYNFGGMILLNGQENNELSLTLAGGNMTNIDGSSYNVTIGGIDYEVRNYVLISLDGFLAKGAALPVGQYTQV